MLSVLITLCCHAPRCYFHPSFSPLNVSNSLTHHISLRFSPLLVFCHIQLIFLPRPTLLPISPCVPTLSFYLCFFFLKKKKNSPTVNKLTSCRQPSLLSLLLKGSRKKKGSLAGGEEICSLPRPRRMSLSKTAAAISARESAAQPSVCRQRSEEAAREVFHVSAWLPMKRQSTCVAWK